jgi:hypothetical protein
MHHNNQPTSILQEIGIYAKSTNSLIVGYYQSDERLDDIHLGIAGEEVVSQLRKPFKPAVALVVCSSADGSYCC